MRVLIIGYGSIGKKHARILTSMKNKIGILSRRNIDEFETHKTLNDAISVLNPEYIIISNNTSEHFETLNNLIEIKFSGKILVEKPLFNFFPKELDHDFSNVYVGYNLRFHPLIIKLKDELQDEKVISLQAYVGQYLPDWRTNRDYTLSYSSKKDEGGGVLRDLSHELDYINWIFGKWIKLSALGGKYSNLNINTEDVYSILFETQKCPVCSLQLNYLDRCSRRNIIVNTPDNVYEIDLVNNIFKKNKAEVKKILIMT